MIEDTHQSKALQALVAFAAIVVIIAGLKMAGDVILPILFSVFLSIVMLPPLRGLQKIGVPSWLAILFLVIVTAGALVGITSIIAGTVRQFTADIGQYEASFNELVKQGLGWATWVGFTDVEQTMETGELSELMTPGAIMALVGQTVNAVVGVFGRVVVVIVTMTFILFEAAEIEQKFKAAFGSEAAPAGPFTDAGEKVTRYLVIKTIVSAITGLCAGALCRILGLDFWVMWALIAFLLNYIPSIGSFVAAVPPILLAIVQLGLGPTVGIAVGYTCINLALGNFIEPRLMGQSLGLSPLVVFLSLVFWGWVWGPVGMLLCVPMTVMVKLVLESNQDTHWIAVFLGTPRDARTEASQTVAPMPPRSLPTES